MPEATIRSAEAAELNRITKLYENALSPLGMTTSQMNILTVVARYEEATPASPTAWPCASPISSCCSVAHARTAKSALTLY